MEPDIISKCRKSNTRCVDDDDDVNAFNKILENVSAERYHRVCHISLLTLPSADGALVCALFLPSNFKSILDALPFAGPAFGHRALHSSVRGCCCSLRLLHNSLRRSSIFISVAIYYISTGVPKSREAKAQNRIVRF